MLTPTLKIDFAHILKHKNRTHYLINHISFLLWFAASECTDFRCSSYFKRFGNLKIVNLATSTDLRRPIKYRTLYSNPNPLFVTSREFKLTSLVTTVSSGRWIELGEREKPNPVSLGSDPMLPLFFGPWVRIRICCEVGYGSAFSYLRLPDPTVFTPWSQLSVCKLFLFQVRGFALETLNNNLSSLILDLLSGKKIFVFD